MSPDDAITKLRADMEAAAAKRLEKLRGEIAKLSAELAVLRPLLEKDLTALRAEKKAHPCKCPTHGTERRCLHDIWIDSRIDRMTEGYEKSVGLLAKLVSDERILAVEQNRPPPCPTPDCGRTAGHEGKCGSRRRQPLISGLR